MQENLPILAPTISDQSFYHSFCFKHEAGYCPIAYGKGKSIEYALYDLVSSLEVKEFTLVVFFT